MCFYKGKSRESSGMMQEVFSFTIEKMMFAFTDVADI